MTIDLKSEDGESEKGKRRGPLRMVNGGERVIEKMMSANSDIIYI